jgi:surface polysaccharide O-acyltransferase-like enzyme
MSNPTHFPLHWADRLRNVATLMVIMIHVSAPIAFQYTDYSSTAWWSGNFWNSLCRPGVPLFVMLSGFLLLGKDYPLGSFLTRRFSRVIIPALFWMLVYLFYGHLGKNDPPNLKTGLLRIAESPVHYHLWFIYLIIGLYLVYPILRPWVKQAKEIDFLYFFVFCAIGTWGYKFLDRFADIQMGVYFELFTNNCGHFVMGYYLGSKGLIGEESHHTGLTPWPWTKAQMQRVAWLLILLGTGSTMGLTWLFNGYWGNGGKFMEVFYDYLTPNVFAAAAGWFLLLRWTLKSSPLLLVEKEFAAASFGIYFAHVIVMDWLAWNGYWHGKDPISYGLLLLFLVLTLLVFLFVKVIRALPWGDKVT